MGRVAATETYAHRLTTERYERLVRSGALDDTHVELVEGLLVEVTPQGPEHAALVQWLTRRFAARAELLRVQLPLAVAEGFEPEPDIALAEQPSPRRHPTTAALVVEVAVTSLELDIAKLPGYAAGDVQQVWLVDVPSRAVHTHRRPAGEAYARRAVLTGDDRLEPSVPGLEAFTVRELFAALG